MNKLTVLFKTVIIIILSLVGVNLWAQTLSTEPGNENTPGSKDNPYLIASTENWNTFASDVTGGYSYTGKYVKLTADITISENAGYWEKNGNTITYKAFSGTFDGDGHIITFNNGTVENPYEQDVCAPFRTIDGATIKNLNVEGTIVTSKKYAGGLIGYSFGTSKIINCISSIDITSTLNNNGDATHGGFAGQQEKGTITFEDCIFEGIISQTTGKTAKKAAGFMGWRGGTVKYTNCIQAGQIVMNSNTATYHRGTNGGGEFENSYYILAPAHYESYGLQGEAKASSAEAPTDDIYRKYTYNTNNYYFPGVVITGLENTMYTYQEGHPVEITPVVKFYCRTLTRGTDYIIKLDGTLVPTENIPTINTPGNHTITIEGIGGYAGSHSVAIIAISGAGNEANPYQISSTTIWDAFAAAVSGGSTEFNDKYYKLTANITVSEMVGAEDNPFKGTFIGKNGETTYTITFNKGTNEAPFDEEYCAPFRYIDGATIKDLNVAGAIYSSKDRAAGLIGKSSGTSTVQDVTVSSTIIATGKSYCSGFASANNGTLNFTNCIYNGKFVAGSSSAGLCASESGTTNINTCMFKPAAETSVSGGQNLSRSSENNITEGYYTYKIGESTQGYGAYTAQPAKVLSKYMPLMDGNNYYVDGLAEIVGVENFYTYTGNTITVTNTVKFFGETIDAANYTVSITPSPVVNRGDYKLTVSGVNGNNYYGSTYTEFSVVSGPLTGSGTEASPYLIASAADWDVFAERVSYGLDADKYYQLTADIEVSTMIGTDKKDFSGVFDGNWHKITFTKGTADSPFNEDYCAPFRYVEDATIQNLTVDGTIISSKKYVGGLVGYFNAYEKGNIVNCTSSVNINCTYITGDCYYGGFVGNTNSSSSGYLRFRNCMFDGSIVDGKETKDAEICSGFIGYVTVQAIDFTRDMIYVNCCMNGTISVKGKTANFHRGSSVPTLFYHTYYLINYTNGEAVQGELAPTSAPDNYISKKYTVSSTDRYVPGAVILSLETVAGGKAPVMAYYGSKLTRGTDFSVSGTSNPYAISGVDGNGFYGSVTTRIVDNWTDLNAALKINNAIVDLVADVTAGPSDGALEVNSGSNVTLNMNGHTIDRNLSAPADPGQVFRISKNKTLTINGNGTITGGYNKRTGTEFDGGGIFNMGTLTLNSVYISRNRCLKKDGEDASGRGGGIYSGPESSLTMNGCYVTSNTAQGGGGGVYGQDASVFVLDDDYFYQNESESKGGGIRVKTKDNVTARITNSNIVWNMVTAPDVVQAAQGGGIYMEYGNLYMENTSITGNISNLQGSGLYQSKGTITAKNCKFTDNGSYKDNLNSQGAGAYLYSGTFIMDGGLITGNNAYAGTGGIYINKDAHLKLKGNVTIFDNYIYTGMKPLYKNVYIADPSSDGVIEILPGFDSGSKIAVFKNFSSGFDGVFTKNLYENGGSVANFVTDDKDFEITQTGGDPNEAQFAAPKAWTDCVDGTDYNKTGESEPYSYEILKPVSVIEGDVTANTISFSGAGCLYIQENSTLTAKFINNDDPVRLVIEDGGQVITTSENVEATVKKKTTQKKWYLISSAIDNPDIEDNTNVITTEVPTNDPPITYDLYRFNEAASLQWENYRAGHGDFTKFTNGRGYLYRDAIILGYTIIMEGTLNVGNRVGGGEYDTIRVVKYPLSYAGTDELKGFNIIGNPYSHNITKGDANANILNEDLLEEKYYVLEERLVGEENVLDWYLNEDGTAIPPMTGVLVQAKKAGEVTITNILPKPEAEPTPDPSKGAKKVEKRNLWFTVANSNYMDEACVEFKEGHGLNKIERMNENAPMLYINYNGEDFASVDMNPEAKYFNLNFEAKTTGMYTLSVKPQGEFGYLHLYDKLTEKDVDLLQESEYSFIGSTADNADRFVVRLGNVDDDENSEIFAYQSGNEIVVSGEGELQVFDVMGRMVMQQHVNGVQTMSTSSLQTGVYILRMGEKTQKIVIK